MISYIQKQFKVLLFSLVWISLCSACNMEKDVEVPLPPYDKQLVVEAYIAPDQPYKLLLTESESYFESVKIPLVNNALVTISYQGVIDTLKSEVIFDTLATKVYNFHSSTLVPPLPGEDEFSLSIEDSKGRKVTASTRILPVVKIDTVEWSFRGDSLANLLIKFTDNPATENFYRLVVNKGSLTSGAEADYSVDDRLLNGKQIPLGTRFAYEKGDTLFVRLYHIDKKYYDFLESIENASSANGNPFAQPSAIKSGVEGGIGIFTGISFDSKEIIIR